MCIAVCRAGLAVGLAVLAMDGGALQADDRGLRPKIEVLRKRALLIGNANYVGSGVAPLKNTIADVRALEVVLNDLGFDSVRRKENLSLAGMTRAVREFASELSPGDLALFYFSGHGVEDKETNENLLLPVDFEVGTRMSDVSDYAYSAGRVLSVLQAEGTKVRVLMLDACRNNPFSDSRSGEGGLAPMAPSAEGDLIVYATRPGQKASDNSSGELGLFMWGLLSELKGEKVLLKQAVERAQAKVYKEAKRRGEDQLPEVRDLMIGDVELHRRPRGPGPEAGADIDWPVREQPETSPYEASDPLPVRPPEKELEDPRVRLLKEATAAFVWANSERSVTGWLSYLKHHETVSEELTRQARDRLEAFPVAERAAGYWEHLQWERNPQVLLDFVGNFEEEPTAQQWVNLATARLERWRRFAPTKEAADAMEFVRIPAGEFRMGSIRGGEVDEGPVTAVTISEAFELGKYEVRQADWELVMEDNPSEFQGCGRTCPVENVSWEDVQRFVDRLNEMAGSELYGIPSEAQWEYAARGAIGDRSAATVDDVAWHGANGGRRTHPAGKKAPGENGLHDIYGNVWEWVRDWSGRYKGDQVTDPTGPRIGSRKVFRGGSWSTDPANCRPANRDYGFPSEGRGSVGFRLLRNVPSL